MPEPFPWVWIFHGGCRLSSSMQVNKILELLLANLNLDSLLADFARDPVLVRTVPEAANDINPIHGTFVGNPNDHHIACPVCNRAGVNPPNHRLRFAAGVDTGVAVHAPAIFLKFPHFPPHQFCSGNCPAGLMIASTVRPRHSRIHEIRQTSTLNKPAVTKLRFRELMGRLRHEQHPGLEMAVHSTKW